MENKKEIFAGIIIIGNEILSGRTQDTNTSTLSIWLNSLGIKVQEVRVIPDIEETIIKTVNELRKKYSEEDQKKLLAFLFVKRKSLLALYTFMIY